MKCSKCDDQLNGLEEKDGICTTCKAHQEDAQAFSDKQTGNDKAKGLGTQQEAAAVPISTGDGYEVSERVTKAALDMTVDKLAGLQSGYVKPRREVKNKNMTRDEWIAEAKKFEMAKNKAELANTEAVCAFNKANLRCEEVQRKRRIELVVYRGMVAFLSAAACAIGIAVGKFLL